MRAMRLLSALLVNAHGTLGSIRNSLFSIAGANGAPLIICQCLTPLLKLLRTAPLQRLNGS